jgi:hypothetical protein
MQLRLHFRRLLQAISPAHFPAAQYLAGKVFFF